MAASATGDDRGETLLELVVAVAIMGVTMVAILGGVATSILMSDIHRKQATAGAWVRDYAESIQSTVAGGGYVDCATDATYAAPAGFSVPAGYAASVLPGSIRYFNAGAWQTGCAADTGLQRVTVQVASNDDRAREQIVIVLRKSCALGDTPCG